VSIAIPELGSRTQELVRQIAQVSNKLDHEIEARQAKTTAMHNELSAALTEYAERERRRTLRGLRYEAAGLFLLALGTTINTLAVIIEGSYQP
jgi:Skp family chaperone for outer membrane proteins